MAIEVTDRQPPSSSPPPYSYAEIPFEPMRTYLEGFEQFFQPDSYPQILSSELTRAIKEYTISIGLILPNPEFVSSLMVNLRKRQVLKFYQVTRNNMGIAYAISSDGARAAAAANYGVLTIVTNRQGRYMPYSEGVHSAIQSIKPHALAEQFHISESFANRTLGYDKSAFRPSLYDTNYVPLSPLESQVKPQPEDPFAWTPELVHELSQALPSNLDPVIGRKFGIPNSLSWQLAYVIDPRYSQAAFEEWDSGTPGSPQPPPSYKVLSGAQTALGYFNAFPDKIGSLGHLYALLEKKRSQSE